MKNNIANYYTGGSLIIFAMRTGIPHLFNVQLPDFADGIMIGTAICLMAAGIITAKFGKEGLAKIKAYKRQIV